MDGMMPPAAVTADLAQMLQGEHIAPMGPTLIETFGVDEQALLGRLIGYVMDAEDSTANARAEADKARRYKDGDQWTEEEKRILRQRRQPLVWNNVIARKVELLRGMERRGRSDPKAYPRTPSEENLADAATQVLRYVSDDQRYDVIRSAVFDNMLVEGFGGCEVIVEPDQVHGDYRVVINHIPWERLFYDPHSQHPGFSDAKYIGMMIWLDREDALDRYPDGDGALASTFEASRSDTYDDKPRMSWCDNQRSRVRVIQIWWKRRSDWWTATFTQGGFLEQPMRSPYEDRHGNAMCPIIMRSAHIGRDNDRFGVCRDFIPIQDSINKRESKLLHALSVNQLILEQGAVQDVEETRREANKPDGVIVHNPEMKLVIHKDTAEIQGQFQLLQYAIGQMNVQGPNASMGGKDPRELSGRAIIAQQAGGMVEHEPIADELRQHTHKVMESVWLRVRQFWSAERWIRVTDNDKNTRFVGINKRITLADELQAMPPDKAAMLAQRLMLRPGDPRLETVVRLENSLDQMDVDITVEEGPDSPTMQAEQFAQIMQLPREILQQFPPEFIIKASSLRNKDELVQMLKDHQTQQAAGQQQQQQAAQSMQQAQLAKLQADAADKIAQAKDRGAQSLVRLHNIAADHAEMGAQPTPMDVGMTGADAPAPTMPGPQPPAYMP